MNSTIALALTWAFREYSYQEKLIKIINFLIFIKKHCPRPTVVRTASTASITTLSRLISLSAFERWFRSLAQPIRRQHLRVAMETTDAFARF